MVSLSMAPLQAFHTSETYLRSYAIKYFIRLLM